MLNYQGMNTKRKFSAQTKAGIVLSIIKGDITLLEASKQHNIVPSLLHKWKDQFLGSAHTIFEQSGIETEQDRKLKKCEHVIAKLTTQNDFLDKVLASLR
jgi:transposase-like protein